MDDQSYQETNQINSLNFLSQRTEHIFALIG